MNEETQESNENEMAVHQTLLHSPLRQQGHLLDMLAEVASKTLFEPTLPTVVETETSSSPIPSRDESYRPPEEVPVNIKKKRMPRVRKLSTSDSRNMAPTEIMQLPPHRLLKNFSSSDCNELRRTFSFTCTLEPDICSTTFTSFGSEAKARKQIAAHLKEHAHQLAARSNDKAANNGLTQVKQEVVFGVASSSLKKEPERVRTKAEMAAGDKGPLHAVKFDHCYTYDGQKEDNDNKESVSNATAFINLELNNASTPFVSETFNIEFINDLPLVPVVGREEDVSAVEEVIIMQPLYALPNGKLTEKVPIGLHTQLDIPYKHMKAKTEQSQSTPRTAKRKAKGKAKFIGQSNSDRALALNMIDQIKRKQLSPMDSLECRICIPARSFTAPTTLLSHYRSHAGIKPFECRICHAAFTRQHSLNYHLLIHSNETRFTCRDCGRKFRHPSHFKEHQRRHTGESPFECERCFTRFKTRNTYKRHLKTRHNQVLSPAGELTSTEPSPPGSEKDPQSPGSSESESSIQDNTEEQMSQTELMEYESPSLNEQEEMTQNKETQYVKEDIVKQAMRSSNINFESDMDEENTLLILNSALNQKENKTEENESPFFSVEHNNNIEEVKNGEKKCQVGTIVTFQYAAALSNTQNSATNLSESTSLVFTT